MTVSQGFQTLVMLPLARAACQAAGVSTDDPPAVRVHLGGRLGLVGEALSAAVDRAWTALEVALEGAAWWQTARQDPALRDNPVFRQQVQTFLDAWPLAELAGKTQFRRRCLSELRLARQAGALRATPAPESLAADVAELLALSGAKEAQAEAAALAALSGDLKGSGWGNLAWLLLPGPTRNETPLVLAAARAFLRHAAQVDPRLNNALRVGPPSEKPAAAEVGLTCLAVALSRGGPLLGQLLGELPLAQPVQEVPTLEPASGPATPPGKKSVDPHEWDAGVGVPVVPAEPGAVTRVPSARRPAAVVEPVEWDAEPPRRRTAGRGEDEDGAARVRRQMIIGSAVGGGVLVVALVLVLILVRSNEEEQPDLAQRQPPPEKKEPFRPRPELPRENGPRPPNEKKEPGLPPIDRKKEPIQPPEERAKPDPGVVGPADAPPWKAPALPVTLTLREPPLPGGQKSVTLPGSVSGVSVGGGGRYLVLHLAGERKLAVFDVNELRVVKYLGLPEDGSLFAAGLDKLLVAHPRSGRLERYDLATGRREAAGKLPPDVAAVCMGSASHGPLLVYQSSAQRDWGRGTGLFYDPSTLEPVRVRLDKPFPNFSAFCLRASANGRVFAGRESSAGEPHSNHAIVLSGDTGRVHTQWMSGSVLLPSPDGRIVYTETAVYTVELRHLFPRDTNHWKPFTPAAHGNFFLRVRGFEREGHRLHPSQEERIRNDVLIYLPGQELPALTLTGIDGAFGDVGGGNPLTRDKRLHLLPAARLLISIPGSNDRLLVRRLDIEAELKTAGKDYLYVDSLPPGGARPGEVWTYRPVVRSNKGGVQYQLDDGPAGMKVAEDGTLTWTPPEAGPPAGVILSVSDAGGGRIFHTFEIAVVP